MIRECNHSEDEDKKCFYNSLGCADGFSRVNNKWVWEIWESLFVNMSGNASIEQFWKDESSSRQTLVSWLVSLFIFLLPKQLCFREWYWMLFRVNGIKSSQANIDSRNFMKKKSWTCFINVFISGHRVTKFTYSWSSLSMNLQSSDILICIFLLFDTGAYQLW